MHNKPNWGYSKPTYFSCSHLKRSPKLLFKTLTLRFGSAVLQSIFKPNWFKCFFHSFCKGCIFIPIFVIQHLGSMFLLLIFYMNLFWFLVAETQKGQWRFWFKGLVRRNWPLLGLADHPVISPPIFWVPFLFKTIFILFPMLLIFRTCSCFCLSLAVLDI